MDAVKTMQMRLERAAEPDVAIDPSNPARAAVVWQEYVIPRTDTEQLETAIRVATTHDSGANWHVRDLTYPHVPGNPAAQVYEGMVEISPDGTFYVLFQQEEADYYANVGHLVLASSNDGRDWVFKRFVDHVRSTWVPEYMDFSISPDTGELHIVTQNTCNVAYCEDPGALYLQYWYSRDGTVWDSRTFPTPPFEPTSSGRTSLTATSPNIEAGPAGLVVTSIKYGGSSYQAYAAVSIDGGRTFGEVRLVHQATMPNIMDLTNSATICDTADGSSPIHLVYRNENDVIRYESRDAGLSWVRFLEGAAPPGSNLSWTLPACGPDGTVYILAQFGHHDPPHFGIMVIESPKDGAAQVHQLVNRPDVDGDRRLREDRGGFAVDAHGAIWMAWGVPYAGRPTPVEYAIIR